MSEPPPDPSRRDDPWAWETTKGTDPEPTAPYANPYQEPGPPVPSSYPPQQYYGPPPPASWPPAPGYGFQPYQQPPPNDGLGVAAMIVGIVGLVLACGYGVGLLGSPVALFMGRASMRRIDASQGRLGGRGMAQAGFVLGIVGTVLLVLLILLIAFGIFALFQWGDTGTGTTGTTGTSNA